jgi:hypothetical protein
MKSGQFTKNNGGLLSIMAIFSGLAAYALFASMLHPQKTRIAPGFL